MKNDFNTFIGGGSGYSNTYGDYNIFIGEQSGYSNTVSSKIVCIGYQAGYSNTATENIYIGYKAGYDNMYGVLNTYIGYTSGEKVYMSDDGGNNWQNISGTLPNIPCNTIVLDENSNLETLYIGTDLGVFTKDSTVSDWSGFNNNSLPNVIVHELEIQYQSNKLIAATYGRGLWSIDLQITSPPSANFFVSDSIFCNVFSI